MYSKLSLLLIVLEMRRRIPRDFRVSLSGKGISFPSS